MSSLDACESGTALALLLGDVEEEELRRDRVLDAEADEAELALLEAGIEADADAEVALERSGPAPMVNEVSKGPSLLRPFWYHGMSKRSGMHLL